MNRLHYEERKIKLEFIASIARSQQAMARILESVADVCSSTPGPAETIRDNLRILTGMQQVMVEAVTGVRWRRVQTGTPSRPWLHPSINLCLRNNTTEYLPKRRCMHETKRSPQKTASVFRRPKAACQTANRQTR